MIRAARPAFTLASLAILAFLPALPGVTIVAQAQQPVARGRVVTDTLWAPALGASKEARIYLPPSYDAQPRRRYPVVYYLHGWTGSERNWVDAGRLSAIADSLIERGLPEMIIVMPDGDDSWYTTWNTLENLSACRRDTVRTEAAASYCVPWPHYDDYIVNNVVSHVDRRYRTHADPARRGIAGLSMGGYGAVTLALNNPAVFAAAASHSGVLAPGYVPEDSTRVRVDGITRLSRARASYGAIWPSLSLAFGRDTTGWWARDPSRLIRRMARRGQRVPALYMDIGLKDRFLGQNRFFRGTLKELGVPHVYREVQGNHDWTFWRANLPESLVWFGTVIGK